MHCLHSYLLVKNFAPCGYGLTSNRDMLLTWFLKILFVELSVSTKNWSENHEIFSETLELYKDGSKLLVKKGYSVLTPNIPTDFLKAITSFKKRSCSN